MKTVQKHENATIVPRGAGGFLNPPTHPEHSWSVSGPRLSMSLTYALTAEYLEPSLRLHAKRILERWEAPAIESPEIQNWIAQVLGYFRGCYQSDSGSWNASDLLIDTKINPVANASRHAGVNLIRKYYPDFAPTVAHFSMAYWGTKPEAIT